MAHLSRRVTLGYAVGQFGSEACRALPASLLLFFMTQSAGIPAYMAGLVVLIPKIWVIAGDILVGILSDRTESRWGKRRPYLFAGAVLSGIGFTLAFNVPADLTTVAKAYYIGAAYLLMSTGMSLFSVPYLAMASELSDVPQERTRLLSYRQWFVLLGGLSSLAGAPMLISALGSGPSAYGKMALLLGPVIGVSMMIPAVVCRVKSAFAPVDRIGNDFRAIFENKRFLLVIAARLAQGIGQGGVAAGGVYYLTLLLGLSLANFSVYKIFSFIGAGFGQVLWVFVASRIGRTASYSLAILCEISSLLAMLAAPPGNFPVIFSLSLWSGIGTAGVSLMSLSILTDVINLDRQETGGRVAMFSSFYTLTEKLAVTIGAFFVASALSFGGFVESHGTRAVQSASALKAVGFAFVGISTLGLTCAFLISLAIARSMTRSAAPVLL
jgi:GPH family glycoside/pentoside/hexuronide:cation symporter